MPQDTRPLYERIGGDFTINAAVDTFYGKVLSDPRINYFFENISMDAQMRKLKGFLNVATGGRGLYTGRAMRESHAKLVEKGLNDTHVDILIEHMESTLRELDTPQSMIDEVITVIESYRDDVLGRGSR